MTGWHPADRGATIGGSGSEGGVVERDDEHAAGARITLERGGSAPFSITCGVYGCMAHTRFFSTRDEAEAAYAAMKPDLATIAEATATDVDSGEVRARVGAMIGAMIGAFVDLHP